MAGALDSLIDFNRSRLFADDNNGVVFLDALVRYGQRVQLERNNAQQSLFGMGDMGGNIQQPRVPVAEDWNNLTTLNKERDVIGLYLSAHPLDRFNFIINKMCHVEVGDLDDLSGMNGSKINVAGVVTSVTPLTTKDGRRYARFIVEDYNTQHEFTLFSRDYEKFGNYIELNNFLFISGQVQPRPYREPEELEFKINAIQHLADVAEQITSIHIELSIGEISTPLTEMLYEVLSANKGKTNIIFNIYDYAEDVRIKLVSKKFRVNITNELTGFLESNDLNYNIINN